VLGQFDWSVDLGRNGPYLMRFEGESELDQKEIQESVPLARYRTMRHVSLCVLLACAMVSGCASITGSDSQGMRVTTLEKSGDEIGGARCRLVNDKGAWMVETPGEVQVRRSNNAISVTCEKEPLPAGHASVPSITRGAMYGNLLFGGVIGIAIDHSSGAGYEYSTHVSVVMGGFTTVTAVPPATNSSTGKAHDRPGDLPEPSGFADFRDVSAVPSPKARAGYQDFLSKPFPRAFAIGEDGGWYASWNRSDSATRAVNICAERAKKNCRLYAYDDVVVWRPGEIAVVAKQGRDAPAPANTSAAVPAAHLFVAPAKTGFAKIEDPLAMPLVDRQGREKYVERYLILKAPKAFAIGPGGEWSYLANDPRSMKTVLERCNGYRKGGCWLYAVDENVVWSDDPAQRTTMERLQPR